MWLLLLVKLQMVQGPGTRAPPLLSLASSPRFSTDSCGIGYRRHTHTHTHEHVIKNQCSTRLGPASGLEGCIWFKGEQWSWYLEQHSGFPERELPGLVLQDVLPPGPVSHHVALELWVRPATRRLGAAGRKQLLQPAAVLSPGRLQLLQLQGAPCSKHRRNRVEMKKKTTLLHWVSGLNKQQPKHNHMLIICYCPQSTDDHFAITSYATENAVVV